MATGHERPTTRRRCGRCHERGHTARHCPRNPEATLRVEVPADAVEVLWLTRLYGIWRAASYDANPLRAAMVSAYLQGAMDGRSRELDAALAALAPPTVGQAPPVADRP